MNYKKIESDAFLFLSVVLFALAAGCGPTEQPSADIHSSNTDSPPRRIVSTTLGADEVLLKILEPDRIAALSSFVDDPIYSHAIEKAKAVEHRVTGNVEQVLALEPDLVICASYSQPEFLTLVQNAGVSVHNLGTFYTLSDAFDNIVSIGEIVHEKEKSVDLANRARARIDAVRSTVEGLPRPSVLSWDVGYIAGAGTLSDEIIRAAGGVNYAADMGIEGHQKIAHEAMASWTPDWVLTGGEVTGRGGAEALLETDPGLRALEPVRENRVLVVHAGHLSSVNHNIARAVEDLARLLHAEAMK